jgi:hypothetical protein
MRYLAAIAVLLWPSVVVACDLDAGEALLFSCETGPSGEKFISICATEVEPGQSWRTAQYRYGTEEKTELAYPDDPAEGQKKLFFSHMKTAHSYTVNVRFKNGGYRYRVFSIAKWEGDEAPAEAMDGEAGVEVKTKGGKLVSTILCSERPYMFPEYLRRALACDQDNPYGARACAEMPPMEH